MKIAIITQPLRTNYGGILQNYALQTVLRKLGHEPITIDYDCRYPKWRWVMGRMKSILMGTRHHIEFPHYGRSGQENLNRFIHENIITTKPVKKPTRTKIERLGAEAVVVGSDQVWSPLCNVPIEFMGNMYLDFLEGWKGLRVAYAASFGSSEWQYTADQTRECSRLVQAFDAVSTREKSGVSLCKEYLNKVAVHVLDPTLLLTAEHYERIIGNIKCRYEHKPYLFAYILDMTEEKKEFLENKASDLGLSLYLKGANDDIAWDDSIEEWLATIHEASYVVTDSFHGTVFSILFHRPFLSMINNRRGADRFYSLLNLLELSNRAITMANISAAEDIDVDWAKVDSLIKDRKQFSMEFLKSAIR